jgi:hypothetical protein
MYPLPIFRRFRAGNSTPSWNERPLALGQARRGGRASQCGVGEALAVGVQPNDFASELRGLSEQRRVTGDWYAQPGHHKIDGESCREGRVGQDRGEIGKHVIRVDARRESRGEIRSESRFDIWDRRGVVSPEREDAASRRSFVEVEIWKKPRKC